MSDQIISGVVVALVSFVFGYFLFRSQTNEQIRLEVYRRRLDCYDRIIKYLDDLDFFSHGEYQESKIKKDEFVKKVFQLQASTEPYVPTKIQSLLRELYSHIDHLPDSLAYVEATHEAIHHFIETDVGSHLTNWRMDFIKNDKDGKKFAKHFEEDPLGENIPDQPQTDPNIIHLDTK